MFAPSSVSPQGAGQLSGPLANGETLRVVLIARMCPLHGAFILASKKTRSKRVEVGPPRPLNT